MTRPNFFLVGAPKCGTSSMYRNLGRHPDIFLSRFKEPHYFCRDLTFNWHPLTEDRWPTEEEYLGLFADAQGEARIGEGSTLYLYSEEATRGIRRWAPDARILIMLRDPVELVISRYRFSRMWGREPAGSLEEALALEATRSQGQAPTEAVSPLAYMYRRLADLGPHVARYLETFGRENVHVVLLDDLKADEASTFQGVLSFLGVDPTVEIERTRENTSRNVRSTVLRDLHTVWQRYPWARRFKRAVLPEGIRRRVSRFLWDLNTDPREEVEVPPELRARLARELRGTVDQLEDLLDRDLGHWCPG